MRRGLGAGPGAEGRLWSLGSQGGDGGNAWEPPTGFTVESQGPGDDGGAGGGRRRPAPGILRGAEGVVSSISRVIRLRVAAPLLVFLAACTSVGASVPRPPPDLPAPSRAPEGAPQGVLAPSPGLDGPGGGIGGPREGGVVSLLPVARVTLPRQTGDVRALWVVRTAILHPDSARAAVRRARDAGFNTLLVQVRGRGDAYFDSRLEPPPEGMASAISEYDPLGTVIDEATRLGLEVHAWVNVHVVASAVSPPNDPRHILRSRPELLAVPRALAAELFNRNPRDPAYLNALLRYTRGQGDRLEGMFTNPADPRVQEHLVAVVRDLVERYPVAGIHFDYLRYPSANFDYSRGSLEAFRSWVMGRVGEGTQGAEGRWPGDPLAYVSAFPGLWDAFRVEQISRTAESLSAAARQARPGIVVSAAVYPDPGEAVRTRFQNWNRWLEDGVVDVVAPMIYTGGEEVFLRQLRLAASIDPRRVWAGVGIYQDTFQTAVEKARAARSLGVGGVALFSYDWAVSGDGSAVASGPYLPRFGGEVWGTNR
ncbi:MAG: hypothetical protein EXR92_06100 [Gemmatimonadetes bacterium]|nr:hypothetical protein [Gemmatimonadota bacterium]